MTFIGVSVKGLQEIERALDLMSGNKLRKNIGRAVIWASAEFHRLAVEATPIDTGYLEASQRVRVDLGRLCGTIDIDPAVTNPLRGNKRPAIYGAELHARGPGAGRIKGTYRFYGEPFEQHESRIARQAMRMIEEGLP